MMKFGLIGGAFDDYNDAMQRVVENAFWNSPDKDNFGRRKWRRRWRTRRRWVRGRWIMCRT